LETAILYTFSTIAQVLATLIALLGAFMVYKLQSINSAMFVESRSLLDRSIFSEQEIHNLHSWRGYSDFQQFINIVNNKTDSMKDIDFSSEWWAIVLFMRSSVRGQRHPLQISGLGILWSNAVAPGSL
jgi:hypothetical protein